MLLIVTLMNSLLCIWGFNPIAQMSDFVSFLLFWRSGCQTLSWCQPRKCCECYCDPAYCSHWRSSKSKFLFLNIKHSVAVLFFSLSFGICSLSFIEYITEPAGMFIFMCCTLAERGERRQNISCMDPTSDESCTYALSLWEFWLKMLYMHWTWQRIDDKQTWGGIVKCRKLFWEKG